MHEVCLIPSYHQRESRRDSRWVGFVPCAREYFAVSSNVMLQWLLLLRAPFFFHRYWQGFKAIECKFGLMVYLESCFYCQELLVLAQKAVVSRSKYE